ncbi:hypothetical protein B0H63DRAFT_524293 [Podospora didyma]|uniref:Nephrocystin 3-like N-terminal domain-containing protein n=1 Tax=Podospora didyma TaxID=330526 RepID=A0AAE0NHE4_9PEZI|nr:hypothetical protein B0H63DRAFT_524293 [Podospora didyma]
MTTVETPPDYWDKALNSLTEDVKSGLNLTAMTRKHDIPQAVLRAVEEKREICLQKRWKFKKSSGEQIVLRDILKKISVRMLLQVTTQDVEIFGVMVNDLEVVKRLITRYREFEQLHLGRESLVKQSMEEALIRLYSEVLTFLGQLIKFFRDSTPDSGGGDHKKQMEKIQIYEAEVLQIANLADTERLHFLELAVTQTKANPDAAPFAYLYCNDCGFEPERSSPDNIPRSLMKQIGITLAAEPRVSDFLLVEYERAAQARVDGLDLQQLQIADCVKLILDIAGTVPLTMVLDAVDELHETNQYSLLDALNTIAVNAGSVVKIFVTCRNDSQIFALAPAARYIQVRRQDTQPDMESFIIQELDTVIKERRLLNGNVPPQLGFRILASLLHDAGEMFLWAKLLIQRLCWVKTEEDVLDALGEQTLATLNGLYESRLRRIMESGNFARNVVVGIFSWLLLYERASEPNSTCFCCLRRKRNNLSHPPNH